MHCVANGYFQDGIKALVYLAPLIYLFARRGALKLRFFWLFALGLGVLFLGHLFDFFDEFESIKNVAIIGRAYPMQDFYEDTAGATLGFAVFMLAIFLELNYGRGGRGQSRAKD